MVCDKMYRIACYGNIEFSENIVDGGSKDAPKCVFTYTVSVIMQIKPIKCYHKSRLCYCNVMRVT